MRLNQRRVGVLLISLLLLLNPIALFAQSDEVQINGSGIAAPLFEALVRASDTSFNMVFTNAGADNGFAALCAGEADVVNALRPISVEEEARCAENGITFREMLLGYEAIAFIVSSDFELTTCVSSLELNALMAPSAAETTTWNTIFPNEENETPLAIYIPANNTSAYSLLDESIAGVGFRADAVQMDTDEDIINAVTSTPGAVGVVSLNSLADTTDVKTLEIQNPVIARCVSPEAETVSDSSYVFGRTVFSYVNADRITEGDALETVYTALANGDLTSAVVEAGFTPPTAIDIENNQQALLAEEPGREFTRAMTEYQIPPTVAGNVNVSGTASAYALFNNAASAFSNQYTTTTVTVNMSGAPAGLEALCSGTTDIVVTNGALNTDTLSQCAEQNIQPLEFEIGKQAVVLVANAASDHLSCLTTDQITATWKTADESVTNWQGIDPSFPDQEFILFAGLPGNVEGDLLMLLASGASVPLRSDTQTSADPRYRAAATANVEGALTYMTWADYQTVLNNGQERIQLVAVNAGNGCIMPDETTIASGEYPLTKALHVAVSNIALQRTEVKSYLWFVFQDTQLNQFERADLDTVNLNVLEEIRALLQEAFDSADVAAAEAAAAEAEAAAEAATEEPTEEATDES